jgi:arylsulfatase A-like enzyme
MEHGGLKHGSSLHREELHVPLVFRIPGGERAGQRRAEPVGLVDVFPTVLALLGIDPPGRVDGVDLFASEPPDPERVLFSETSHGWARVGGATKEGVQLLAARGPKGRTVIVGPDEAEDYPRVYEDPEERTNLAASAPPWRDALAAAAKRWREETAARVLPNEPMSPEDYAELRESLIKLGYIARPQAPGGAGEAPEGEKSKVEPPSGEK